MDRRDSWQRPPPSQNNGNSNRAMNMAIPRRRPSAPPPQQQQQQQSLSHHHQQQRPTPSMASVIPRRTSGTAPSLTSAIPRRSSGASNNHNNHNNSGNGGGHHPHRHRSTYQGPPLSRGHHNQESLDHNRLDVPTPPQGDGNVSIQSEFPFIVKFDYAHSASSRRTTRTPKRKRPTYQELQDTDSDDFLTDSDDDKKKKSSTTIKKAKRLSKSTGGSGASIASFGPGESITNDVPAPTNTSGTATRTLDAAAGNVPLDGTGALELNNTSVDSPPPGTLNTLWYSRESFLHVFVLEKILAWKTRPITQLEWVDEHAPPPEERQLSIPKLDTAECAKLTPVALTNPTIWNDARKRMEVSRLAPTECPIVLSLSCAKEVRDSDNKPKFRIRPIDPTKREEVYLVKWRGRSHMHASWERGSDIIKYDQSNNTARQKLRRFVQSQEVSFGKKWKDVLEEERKSTAAIHAQTGNSNSNDDSQPTGNKNDQDDEAAEEYFPPQCLEIERILACDESEMEMSLFAKQRAYNLLAEQERLRQRELPESQAKKWNSQEKLEEILKGIPWDPEDNVRYVVKWKGLPFAEMTWEYWRDIKRDAVGEAEDFWYRQRVPDAQEIKNATNKTNPHIRDFRKMQESPVFGISNRERPIAKIDGLNLDDDDGDSNPGFKLRSYQLEGVNWLLFNWWNRRSCILADEMGLGKTIQSMCFLKQLQDLPTTQVRGPFLIVAPLSLIGQWQSEARSWAPDLNVVLYHGSADARDFLVKQEFYYTDQFVPKQTAMKLKKQHVTKFHILITTYEVVLKDINVISKVRWRALIVDEAHRLKNSKSRLFEELATVPRDYCVLLTGTPLANATEELWALLHFANPVAFASKDEFLEKFGQLKDADQVNELHSILKPYLLRRVKEDVEKSLPPKEETILEVSLTPIQKKYYKAIYERNTSFLFKGSKPSNAPSLMNVMMELRKCCNHPYLVKGAEERIMADAAANLQGKKDENGNDVVIDYGAIFGDQLVKSSGKMVLIAKLLPKLFAGGHKVLIFSQMVRVLDLLEELLKILRYKYERLDGSTSSSSRAAAVDRFIRKSCQRFVMLLSTRAGGLGLNLTAADVVIIFDSDWNPQNDLQAMARAHRIGQTRAVRVYRLLTAKTYEMHMFHSASMKLGLERAVLSQQRDQGDESEEGGKSKAKAKSEREAQAKEIDELLKKGAYDVFRDDDDGEAEKFMETDIDQLLERSAKTITYGSAETNLSSGLGSFSKASFVADTGDGEKDIDLDDPDFWSKAVGLDAPVETPEDVAAMLDDGVKRSRKQVQVFDPYAEFAEIEQRKKDKIALKEREAKEEKERLRMEKKLKKKKSEKERKKRSLDETKGPDGTAATTTSTTTPKSSSATNEEPPTKKVKDPKKKLKKGASRRRAMKRLENEDPVLERLKQAWDISQRNRATAAALRFGFPRFCKLRHESNLTSLPIQDLEVFTRSYFYQLLLQVCVSLMTSLRDGVQLFDGPKVQRILTEWLGPNCAKELGWLTNSFSATMKSYYEVETSRRFLQVPLCLAEPSYVITLRKGQGLRALRRIFLLGRVQRFIEDMLDEILTALGYEELGKRGFPTSDISIMDVDLKARLVTTEELSLAVGVHLNKVNQRNPTAWWNRSCDVGLLIGTFVHGLGNYEAMLNDEALPFAFGIRKFTKKDEACSAAHESFNKATNSVRKVFDDALESAKLKAQAEVHAAVAAAAKASSEREQDALALRQGGAAADAVLSSMPTTASTDNAYEFDGDDSHFVTLPRLKQALIDSYDRQTAAAAATTTTTTTTTTTVDVEPVLSKKGDEGAKADANSSTSNSSKKKSSQQQYYLSMPDARVLDYRLTCVMTAIESRVYSDDPSVMEVMISQSKSLWPSSKEVSINTRVRSRVLTYLQASREDELLEYTGIGLSGMQCGTTHRSLDDGTDFSLGAASAELSHVAYGADAPRYLRAIGVPMNMTRFAVSALVHADKSCVDTMVKIQWSNNIRKTESTNDGTGKDNGGSSSIGDGKGSTSTTTTTAIAAGEDNRPKAIVKTEDNATDGGGGGGGDGASTSKSKAKEKHAKVPKEFRESTLLRASVCVTVLYFGPPSIIYNGQSTKVRKSLWTSLREQCGAFDDAPVIGSFNFERFKNIMQLFSKDVPIPDESVVVDYVDNHLLPHCLQLCLLGNGPTTRNARGSKGEYETSLGISLYPEHGCGRQSPLPDPCLPAAQQSLEAIANAFAILRRVRIMRAAAYIASGKVSSQQLDEVLRSSFMRKSMEGLPVWWCPWIHDVAILVHAVTRGLFAILCDRGSEIDGSVAFSQKALVQHLYSTFIAEENVLPRSILDEAPPEDATSWIEAHANQFPSANVLERRLAFLCSKATEHVTDENRYINLPMFDHGGWPRN